MDLLLTELAHRRWWPDVVALAPDARPVLVSAGDERLDTSAVEVAWSSTDVFHTGLSRRFFGAALHAPGLRWFHTPNAGINDPFFHRLLGAGVRVTTSHHHAENIADYVLHAALDHVLGAREWREAQREGVWRAHGPGEVAGTTWLVVGYGAIGREVARRGRFLGARVVGVRRREGTGGEPVDLMVAPGDLGVHLPDADVTVVCLPLNDETQGSFGADLFGRMKPGSLLVNVGRGPVLDEAALLEALDRGTPGAAVLDVTVEEPLPEGHPLWSHPGVTITPHDSGAARGEALETRAAHIFLDNLRAYVAGNRMPDEVG